MYGLGIRFHSDPQPKRDHACSSAVEVRLRLQLALTSGSCREGGLAQGPQDQAGYVVFPEIPEIFLSATTDVSFSR